MRLALALSFIMLGVGCGERPGRQGEKAVPPNVVATKDPSPLTAVLALPSAERDALLDTNKYSVGNFRPQEVDLYFTVAVPRLLSQLADADPAKRSAAAAAVADRIWSQVSPRHRFRDANFYSDVLLERLPHTPGLLDALARATGDTDPGVRTQAARALALLGPRAEGATSALRGRVDGAAGGPRLEAAEALWWVARAAPELAGVLDVEFRSDDLARRRSAGAVVRRIAGVGDGDGHTARSERARLPESRMSDRTNPTTKALLAASDHLLVGGDEFDRFLGADDNRLLLGFVRAVETAPDRPLAVEVLVRAPGAVAAVVKAPPQKGREVVLEAAGRVIKGPTDPAVRLRMLDAVQAAGPEAAEVTPVVIELVGHRDPRFRQRAAEVLGSFGGAAKAAVPVLVKGLLDEDLDARYAAGQALKRVDPEAAKKALVP